jgi:hypothetical protein
MSYDRAVATNGTQARNLIKEVLADTRDAQATDAAERQRLRVESDRALERLHQAVAEFVSTQPAPSEHRREPASTR